MPNKDNQTSYHQEFITRIEDQITSKHTWPALCMDWMDTFIQDSGLTCDSDRRIIEWDDSGKICHIINEDPSKRIAICGCYWKNTPVTESNMTTLVKRY